MPNEKEYIDADYVDTGEFDINEQINKTINGEPLYYTTTQVSKLVDEPPSTIRYWTKRFDKILNVSISNKNRAYTMTNIEQLKFIKKLAKEDGLTLQQIEQYCTEKGFNNDGLVDQSKPLAIKVVTEALLDEMNTQLTEFKKDITKQVTDILIESQKRLIKNNQTALNNIKDEICVTVDEVVSDKMDEKIKDINSSIKETIRDQQSKFIDKLDKKEEEAKKRLLEIDNNLKKSMEEQRTLFDKMQNSNKKGFFKNLFSK